MAVTVSRAVGARIRRREDPRFLTGSGRYVDDLRLPGLLHLAFVRSTHAHALLRSIDAAEALRVPGVVGVFTAAEIADLARPIRASVAFESYKECDMPPLAVGKVRMVGEPIAAVVAESRYQAEDGEDAVAVEYEPLAVVTSIEQALAPGAPVVHDEIPDNVFNAFSLVAGDPEAAFASADLVVELELRSQRVAPLALEGRVAVADFRPSGESTLYLSSQAPHLLRTGLAKFLDMAENEIRVISPDVGGGFGAKLVLYPEYVAVAAVSKRLGRPVKWASDRTEELQTTLHGRQQIHRIKAAASREGRVLGVKVEILADNGAYAVWPMTAALDGGQASENVTGPYDIQDYERTVRSVVTNKGPMGPYRGVGRPMACFSIESVMDEIARRLDLDPLEVRLRNVVREFPHETPAGLRFESGSYVESIELAREKLGYPALRAEHDELRRRGRYRGVGFALAVEHSALGPGEVAKKGIEIGLGYEPASVRVEPDGKVRLAVAVHSHGQGHETTLAQIVADELGVPVEDVTVVYGDTATSPYGFGTWASRSTVYAGGAATLAARDVRDKAVRIAALMLEAAPEDLAIADGRIAVEGSPSRFVTFADVGRRANHEPHLLPGDIEPGLDATRRYMAPDPGSFSNMLHAAVVEVDVETGELEILRYLVVEDCGTMINPMIVEGQVHGGVAQGLGHAVLEELVYDESGQLVSSSLMDYLVPGFQEVPNVELFHLESPSPFTLGGFKGMGEGGAIPVPAAIAGAVSDALAPFGIVIRETPVTPDRIVAYLCAAKERSEVR